MAKSQPSSSNRPPGTREEDAWLSDEQLAKCAPAETEEFQSPVPTRMVSNGEYMPIPQTEKQQRVEARIKELSDSASKKLGVSRRRFLVSTGGMAAAFLAMNEVFGHFFDVSPIEMFEPAAYAATGTPANLFVFDDQTHMVRSSMTEGRGLRAIAQGPGPASFNAGFLTNPYNPTGLLDELGGVWTPWNPSLGQQPNTGDAFHLIEYIKGMYFDSQVTVAILSNANIGFIQNPGDPAPRPPKNVDESLAAESLTGLMTGAVRDFINTISGSVRCLAHGQIYPGIGNLDFMQQQIEQVHPDSWKGYNIATAAKVDFNPDSLLRQWRLDDEEVAYPTYEVIVKNAPNELKNHPGYFNICIHKGLAPGPPDIPERGNPTDIAKAVKDWPMFNFIIYHSCIRPAFFDYESLQEINSGVLREGVPDIQWTTQFAVIASQLPRVYGDLGTTWASSVVTFPTVAAHIMGQLMKFMGPDRIVFGSDSLWYGNPQWQIDALWRFQIPEELQQRWGYPPLTQAAKRKILGLNSARLYRMPSAAQGQAEGHEHGLYKPVPANYESLVPDELKSILEFPGYASDKFSRIRKEYVAMGGERSNSRFGWIRTAV